MLKIKVNEMKGLLEKALQAKEYGIDRALLFLSSPGIGKTSLIKQVAKANKIPCHIISPVQHAAEDFAGIPVPNGNDTIKKLPVEDIFPKELRKEPKGIYFIDELTSAEFGTQGALYRLLLEGRTDTFTLPKGWLRVAAGNLMTDKALVNDLSSALINRVSVFQVQNSAEELVTYLTDKYVGTPLQQASMDMSSFLLTYPDIINEEPRSDEPFTSPRSIERAIEDVKLGISLRGDISEVATEKWIAWEIELGKLPKGQEFIEKPELITKHKAKVFSILPIISAYINTLDTLGKPEWNKIEKFILSDALENLGKDKEFGTEFIYMFIKQIANVISTKNSSWTNISEFIKKVTKKYPFLDKIGKKETSD